MNVSVAQENLSKGLGMATRAVSARNPLPILGNVLLATDEGGRLRLAATGCERPPWQNLYCGWFYDRLGLRARNRS